MNPDKLDLGIHIFVCVQSTHVYMQRGRPMMRSWTNCCFPIKYSLFQKSKAEDVNVKTENSYFYSIDR